VRSLSQVSDSVRRSCPPQFGIHSTENTIPRVRPIWQSVSASGATRPDIKEDQRPKVKTLTICSCKPFSLGTKYIMSREPGSQGKNSTVLWPYHH
jgi:hypothetical protein